jgi:hypothetical protein
MIDERSLKVMKRFERYEAYSITHPYFWQKLLSAEFHEQ